MVGETQEKCPEDENHDIRNMMTDKSYDLLDMDIHTCDIHPWTWKHMITSAKEIEVTPGMLIRMHGCNMSRRLGSKLVGIRGKT